jgi:hypothetical protein
VCYLHSSGVQRQGARPPALERRASARLQSARDTYLRKGAIAGASSSFYFLLFMSWCYERGAGIGYRCTCCGCLGRDMDGRGCPCGPSVFTTLRTAVCSGGSYRQRVRLRSSAYSAYRPRRRTCGVLDSSRTRKWVCALQHDCAYAYRLLLEGRQRARLQYSERLLWDLGAMS